MIVDSNSDNSVNIPPPTRKESGASTKIPHSVPRNAPDHTSSSKPQRPAPVNVASEKDDGGAPSKTLAPDVKQAVISDIQAIIARHMARAASSQEFGDEVDMESTSSDSAREDDRDVVMVDRNQEELSSDGEKATQESPQIPKSEKQKGKQREADSERGSLDDVEMIEDELTGPSEYHQVGHLSTSSGFLSVEDQSFNEDQDMEYDDEDVGVVGTLDDGTGPSPWTTEGSASRPETPQDMDDGASSNEHAPRTPQAGQRRDRQFFSGTSNSFLSFLFNN